MNTDVVIVTRHETLVKWLNNHGIFGPVFAQVTEQDIRGKDVYGILPMWLAAHANSVTEVSMPGLPLEARGRVNGGDYTVEQMDEWGATLKTFAIFSKDELDRAVPGGNCHLEQSKWGAIRGILW